MARTVRQSADSIEIPASILDHTTSDALATYRDRTYGYRTDSTRVPISVTVEAEEDLNQAADIVSGGGKFKRALSAIISAERGEFGVIPNISAAASIMGRFLATKNPSGWLYRETEGGVQPYLVVAVALHQSHDPKETPTLVLSLRTASPVGASRQSNADATHSLALAASDVSRRAPEKILLNAGYALETPDLRKAYDEEMSHFMQVAPNFAEQFRYKGTPVATDSWHYRDVERSGRVVLDLSPKNRRDFREEFESEVTGEVHDVPVMMTLPVFDLQSHDFITVRAAGLTEYVYDETLADKLVLPESHRTLMDVLTTEIESFTGDFIEDKAAGNVILCQGIPGVGKTLTAEVYAEIIKRPLYSLSTVSLGITPEDVAKALQKVFERAKRWNVVLLLDEADVFVTQRGTDLTRDAIVAEFLRVMERFDGLMFMTTNLSNVIDEAILSRCAAIVPYALPDKENARLVWEKIAQINDIALGDELLTDLVETFPKAAPRDIKMLLRLVLRVSRAQKVEITLDLFKRYSVFRSMVSADEGSMASGETGGSAS